MTADEQGALLLDLMRGQALEGFERSFKMAGATLLANRYLLGVRRQAIAAGRVMEICAEIGMPGNYLADFGKKLAGADTLHFGFEQTETGCLYKTYLEFWGRLNQALAGDQGPGSTVLLYQAFKWDPHDPAQQAVTEYRCHPRLGVEAILARLAEVYRGHADAASAEVAGKVARLAGAARPPTYLEVSEEGNPRLSFDLNVYDAGLRVEEIAHLLERIRGRYAIAADQFTPLLDRVRRAQLGHISGGVARDGRDFLTVYYETSAR